MNKYKVLLLTLSIVLGLTTLLVVTKPQAQVTPSKSSEKSKRKKDNSHFPIANFSAESPRDAKRRAREEKRNKSDWRVHPDASGDTTVLVDRTDLTLPAFPVQKASAVVIGTVTDAKSYLSTDKTGVFSSFCILVEDVLKNPGNLSAGSLIEGEREGGRVQFPSGRVRLYMVSEQDMPAIGGRYIFFLNDGDNESIFEILTGYQMKESSILPLDELPNSRSYENAPSQEFLKELKTKIVKP
jgi:hypothetical protein